jgi:hypothetical protein
MLSFLAAAPIHTPWLCRDSSVEFELSAEELSEITATSTIIKELLHQCFGSRDIFQSAVKLISLSCCSQTINVPLWWEAEESFIFPAKV